MLCVRKKQTNKKLASDQTSNQTSDIIKYLVNKRNINKYFKRFYKYFVLQLVFCQF